MCIRDRLSSPRVGPSYDTLRLIIQPHPDRTTYLATRLHFDGSRRTDVRMASGQVDISPGVLNHITTPDLIQRILDDMHSSAQRPPPPRGPQGVQQTLNLDFSP